MKNVGQRSFQLNFRGSIRELYHGREEVSIRLIDELPGPVPGVRILFSSGLPGFSHFLLSSDDGPFSRSPDGAARVAFSSGGPETRAVRVRAVAGDGRESGTYTVRLSFTPRDGGGREDLPNNMLRIATSPLMHTAPSPMEDWAYPIPTREERAFAERTWGGLLAGVSGDYDRAKALAGPIMEALWPRRGTPSDAMGRMAPFEQYEAMVSGREKGFCTSFSAVFECACKSFDILARRVSMAEVPCVSHRLFAQIGANHSTTEIFSRELNQWILMDLSYYMLGAFLGVEGPLTAAEFHLFMNEPNRRKRLMLLVYDTAERRAKMVPFAGSPRGGDETFPYEGWETVFTYRKI